MNDVRRLLKNKEYIEKLMQRADPLMRVVMQRRLDRVCERIEEAREEWHKPLEPQEIDLLKQRVAKLEASNMELLEALEDCCVIAKPKNPSSCCPAYRPGEHGGCAENEDCECNIWKAIQKARGQG